jgi:hypothetical protein
VSESVPTPLNELSEDDIVSEERESPPSLVAATGIDFAGLERTVSVPMQRWSDRKAK